MKKRILLIMVLLMFVFSGCSQVLEEEKVIDKPVKTMVIKEELAMCKLEYVGVIAPEEITKLSFKSPGKIASIKVEAGETVSKGQALVILDTKDISYSVQAAKAARDAAESQYEKAVNGATKEEINIALTNLEKAKNAYEFAENNYQRMLKLFEAGGLSKQEMEGAKLELDIRQEEYNAANEMLVQIEKGAREEDKKALKAQLDQANVDLNHKQSMVADANMKANISGYVMDILFRPGEMVASGYPVIVLGSTNSVAKFGLTPTDVKKVNIGDDVKVEVDGEYYDSKIKSIEKIMDTETRTFNVEAVLEGETLPSGSIAKIYIPESEYNSIRIPITSVMRSSYDFVYIVEEDKAKRKRVELGPVEGELVEVLGLEEGDMLVIEGMKNLNDKDLVVVKD